MSDARAALVVDEVIRQAVDAAARRGIVVAAREDGQIRDPVVAGTIDAVRAVMAVRGEPEQLKSAHPWKMLARRASELHNFPQLVPFVHRELITAKRLPEPVAIDVRMVAVDMPSGRGSGGVGGKRAGLAGIALHAPPLMRLAGWAAVDREHVIELGPHFDRERAEESLAKLLAALTAAHPGTPVVIETLTMWPHRDDGIYSSRIHELDVTAQLKLHPHGQLIFHRPAPSSRLYFTRPEEQSQERSLTFRRRDIGLERTIEMIGPFAREHFFETASATPWQSTIDAITRVEAESTDSLYRYTQQFEACGVLIGNAQSGAAIALRAACVAITDLLLGGGVTSFADRPIDTRTTPTSETD